MGKALVITEKPSAGRDMAQILECRDKKDGYFENEKYIVTWADGHLVGLKYPEEHGEEYKKWSMDTLPLVFPVEESLKVLPETKKQFGIIKKLIDRKDVDYLINAGDAGREGLLIQEWICRMAGNRKPVRVLWASSFTKQAVLKCMDNLKDSSVFESMLAEAEARAEGDYLLGMNYSRLLTLTRSEGKTLSYGRCQTPLLNLIVTREDEIENFRKEPYYTIEAIYEEGIRGVLVPGNDLNRKAKFYDREEAETVLSVLSGEGKVVGWEGKEKVTPAPLLYNLADLQRAMGTKYGYTPDVTLRIAQKLYEKRILSYPRTDSRYLSSDLAQEIMDHLESCRFGLFKGYIGKITAEPEEIYFDDLKVTDHYAMIPTINSETEKIYAGLSTEEKNVFDAVVLKFISIFYPPYRMISVKLYVVISNYIFLTRGKKEVDAGYRAVLDMDLQEEDKGKEPEEEEQEIPLSFYMEQGREMTVKELKINDETTTPPPRYTVSSLIGEMCKYRIGTAATRADILNKLLQRHFIEYRKGKYIPTETGKRYISVLPEELKNIRILEEFEKALMEIEGGMMTKGEFLESLKTQIIADKEKMMQEPEESVPDDAEAAGICPKCGRDVYMKKESYRCSGGDCDFSFGRKIAGKMIPPALAGQLLQKGYTIKIKGFQNKAGKKFNARLVIKPDKTVGFKF